MPDRESKDRIPTAELRAIAGPGDVDDAALVPQLLRNLLREVRESGRRMEETLFPKLDRIADRLLEVEHESAKVFEAVAGLDARILQVETRQAEAHSEVLSAIALLKGKIVELETKNRELSQNIRRTEATLNDRVDAAELGLQLITDRLDKIEKKLG